MSPLDQLLVRVQYGPGCWEWMGAHDHQGYSKVSVRWAQSRGLSSLAYRAIYQLSVGEVPAGLTLDHLCRNRGCVNPSHLEPVTQAENTARGMGFAAVNARKTHCPTGHPYDEQNTYRFFQPGNSRRCCRACNRAAVKRYKARQRSKRTTA